MDQAGEQAASDNLKLPTEVNGRVIQLKGGEKNGNLDRQTSSRWNNVSQFNQKQFVYSGEIKLRHQRVDKREHLTAPLHSRQLMAIPSPPIKLNLRLFSHFS